VREEYQTITQKVLKKALCLGIRDLQVETEFTMSEMGNLMIVGEIVRRQKEIIEEYAREYDLHLGLRVTIPDIRDFGKLNHDEDGTNRVAEAFASTDGVMPVRSGMCQRCRPTSFLPQQLHHQ